MTKIKLFIALALICIAYVYCNGHSHGGSSGESHSKKHGDHHYGGHHKGKHGHSHSKHYHGHKKHGHKKFHYEKGYEHGYKAFGKKWGSGSKEWKDSHKSFGGHHKGHSEGGHGSHHGGHKGHHSGHHKKHHHSYHHKRSINELDIMKPFASNITLNHTQSPIMAKINQYKENMQVKLNQRHTLITPSSVLILIGQNVAPVYSNDYKHLIVRGNPLIKNMHFKNKGISKGKIDNFLSNVRINYLASITDEIKRDNFSKESEKKEKI